MFVCPVIQAKPYPDKDKQQLKRILRDTGTDNTQIYLLLRRMEVRQVPLHIVKRWVDNMSTIKGGNLPVSVVVDRLQQGLIKDVPVKLISRSLEQLYGNLNWGLDILSSTVLAEQDLKQGLDSDDESALADTIVNLEFASRQGYKKPQLEKIITSYSKNIQQAAKLSEIITVWTNYGVRQGQVLFNLSRGMRVGMSVDDMDDVSQAVDSQVVSKRMTSPGDITRLISATVRVELDKLEAEQSFRYQMQQGIRPAGATDAGTSSMDSGMTGGGGSTGGSTSGGSSGGGMTGGDSGGSSGGGGMMDGGSGGDSGGGGMMDGGSGGDSGGGGMMDGGSGGHGGGGMH